MMQDMDALRKEIAQYRQDGADECVEWAKKKWVRVMCDYFACGVWEPDRAATLPHLLPISAELIARILDWQKVCDSLEPWDTATEDIRYEAWASEGLAIAVEMKRQLPDWIIVYHDERRTSPQPTPEELLILERASTKSSSADRAIDARLRFIDRYRPWFEYEITPEVARTGKPPDNYPK